MTFKLATQRKTKLLLLLLLFRFIFLYVFVFFFGSFGFRIAFDCIGIGIHQMEELKCSDA